MSEDPDSVTLRYLSRLDEKVDNVTEALSDMAADVRGIKSHMAGFMQNEVAKDSALASVKDWLTRIERRLDISGGGEQ